MLRMIQVVLLLLLALPAWAAQGQVLPVRENPENPIAHIHTTMGDIYIELFPAAAPRTVQNFMELARTGFYENTIFHRVIDGFMIQGGDPTGTGTGGPGYSFADEINARALGLDKEKVVQGGYLPHPSLGVNSQEEFQQLVVLPLIFALGISSQEELDARREEVERTLFSMSLKDAYVNLGYEYSENLPSRPLVKGALAMANSGPATNGSQFFITLDGTPWLTGKHTVFGQVLFGMDVVEAIGKVRVDMSNRPRQQVSVRSVEILDQLPPLLLQLGNGNQNTRSTP